MLRTNIFRNGDFGERIGALKCKGFFVKASGTYMTRVVGIYVYYKDLWCVIFDVSYLSVVTSEFARVLCSRCATLSASEL